MQYWLMKSEPDEFGWDDLLAAGETMWDGVRNHRAANNLRAMQKGDQAFFYHSVKGKEIVGIMEVAAAGLSDRSDTEGKWASVRVVPVRVLERAVTLKELKSTSELQDMEVVRLSRLSVAKVKPAEWKKICAMAKRLISEP